MKKKFFLTVLALMCALTCALGFAACNDGNNEKPEPDNEPQVDTHQVSSNEWSKAFLNVTKYTLEVTDYECNSSGASIGDGDLTEIYMYDGTNYRRVLYSASGRSEVYLTKQSSGWKYWVQSGDKWTGTAHTDKMAENVMAESITYLNNYNIMGSNYEYKNGKYIRKAESYVHFFQKDDSGQITGQSKEVTISQVTVEFDKGALVSVVLKGKAADKQGSSTGYGYKEYKFTFATATISLPYGVN